MRALELQGGCVKHIENPPTAVLQIVDLANEHKFLPQLLDHSSNPSFVVTVATMSAASGQLNIHDWMSGVLSGEKPQVCVGQPGAHIS